MASSVVREETNHGGALGSRCAPAHPPWKLYHNPHYCFRHGRYSYSYSSSPRYPSQDAESPPMIVVFDDEEEQEEEEVELDLGYGAMSSELELCVDRIRELRAELEFERRMRRKAEALAEALVSELAEERRRGEALREEAASLRAEVEEERRTLRVAELWREERVQMKLADARAAMEEKLREIDDAVAALHASATGNRSSSCCSTGSPVGKSSPSRSQQSPSRSPHHQHQLHGRRDGENPHIRRGIMGFVEFPRAVRVARPPPREERAADLVSNLECQRAQLRVLMRRHRNPAAGMGIIGAAENLVV